VADNLHELAVRLAAVPLSTFVPSVEVHQLAQGVLRYEEALHKVHVQATRRHRASSLKRYLETDLEIIEAVVRWSGVRGGARTDPRGEAEFNSQISGSEIDGSARWYG
jgi:hypothetical protein